jgi:BirA family biotin operon repressor/biotin-[acetyl-CoA-carboxylase] ligase
MNRFSDGVSAALNGQIYRSALLDVYPILDTTMRVADERIRANAPDGLTVIALEQTAGRGSNTRTWASARGNAMFSRIVAVRESEFGQEMEMIAACAVAEIISALLPTHDIQLKYPNDILIDGEKICGCLVPPIYDFAAGTARQINLGVGVNLHVAPQLPDRQTTSLAAHGVTLSIDAFMQVFEQRFNEILSEYRTVGDFNIVLTRMGFLNSQGLMTLHHNQSGAAVSGHYAGFEATNINGKPTAFLKLDAANGLRRLAVHDYTTKNTPQRQTAPPQPRWPEVVPNG